MIRRLLIAVAILFGLLAVAVSTPVLAVAAVIVVAIGTRASPSYTVKVGKLGLLNQAITIIVAITASRYENFGRKVIAPLMGRPKRLTFVGSNR